MLNLGCVIVCVFIHQSDSIFFFFPFSSLSDRDCQAVERDLCSAHPLPVTGGGTHTCTLTPCSAFSPLPLLRGSIVRRRAAHTHTFINLSHTELQMDRASKHILSFLAKKNDCIHSFNASNAVCQKYYHFFETDWFTELEVCFFLCLLASLVFQQHQQQVVQAMERAKQVTMGELNASIGVRGLPPLPNSVCTLYSHIFIFSYFLIPFFFFFLKGNIHLPFLIHWLIKITNFISSKESEHTKKTSKLKANYISGKFK